MTTATAPEATEKAAELAKKESIDLSDVKGTGSGGRIGVKDVEKAIVAKKDSGSGSSAASSGSGSSSESSSKSSKRKESMPDRAHLEGCPQDESRIEFYDQRVPAKHDSNGGLVEGPRVARMAHCVECGGSVEIKG